MKTKTIDYTLLGVSFLLISIGILILASTSASLSWESFGSSTHILLHQIKFGYLPGLLLGGLCFLLPLEKIKKWSLVILLVTLLFTGLVFLPIIGVSMGGSSRWINLGIISFQPSEFLKIGLIVYLAAWISGQENKFSLKKFNHHFSKRSLDNTAKIFIPFVAIIGIIGLIFIRQPDISTLGVIVLTAFLMYFVANTRIFHTLLLFALGIAGFFALISFTSYRSNRILAFMKEGIDPMGIGYQIKQSLIAIGSGGTFGKGIGMSVQKFGFLPQTTSDSIFSIFAEESGFIGSISLVILFLLFAFLGIRISKHAPDKFSQILALGIICWITIQAFINIGAVTEIIPLTGIPLPFISYGGSHIVAELIGIGILLNISKHT